MTKLDIAKDIIKENYEDAECGIFNSRNMVGDPMVNLYNANSLCIDICYNYAYFEVFGLSDKEFHELEKFYNDLARNEGMSF